MVEALTPQLGGGFICRREVGVAPHHDDPVLLASIQRFAACDAGITTTTHRLVLSRCTFVPIIGPLLPVPAKLSISLNAAPDQRNECLVFTSNLHYTQHIQTDR